MTHLAIFALAVWLVANALDYLTTRAALKRPGIIEGNPVAGHSLQRVLILKAVLTFVFLHLLIFAPRYTAWPVIAASVAYVGVAAWNWRVGR